MSPRTLPDEPLWYKDAIIYEVHVRAFHDSNGDGVGDFPGLTQKLDYLADLGVTSIWLLPFYPSPLRDDGYDIAHYEGVHPAYGTLRDVRHFLREAHDRGLRVVTELVVNHTSDQHPWFQAARRAPAGSSKRNYYVWSDTDRKYSGVRIIFTDTETSNWTWDQAAGAYYWHRFFHHQPDLNFDNPRVRRAIMKTMRFWLDMGVDGLRLDAVPYLVEREGTNCENLPESHEILKAMRRDVDANYRSRMLLAEANQWPADVRPYFGDGDECHMAFHFPLMPRIFMSLKQEDRRPITEILRQTPEIPDNCQWALFLRNHDELTLEMCTDEERDYMYEAYAADPQMRLNLGIRRRLAPLMENNRLRIELLNSLLFSLPGTPVIYYGDEIGMGDNIYLGDRNGVRTPMQWTGDRNAGFSRADPARLYAPPIMDPVYGYQALNVEAQQQSPASLLNWMKRLIALRRQHRTFGRGRTDFLAPSNRKVLAFVRSHEDDVILVVANLSRAVQPVELDLSAHAGLHPVELLGQTEFPRIADRPYFLTLGPYAFYWFQLTKAVSPLTVRAAAPTMVEAEPLPAFFAGVAWYTLLDGNVRHLLEREALPRFLPLQRWFAGKDRPLRRTRIADWAVIRTTGEPAFLTVVDVEYENGTLETYLVPLALAADREADRVVRESPAAVVARVTGARKGIVFDGLASPGLCDWLLAAIDQRRELQMQAGVLRAWPTTAYERVRGRGAALKATPVVGEQSNSSIVYGDRLILKVFRRLQAGPNPDVEIGRYLTEKAGFARMPPAAGVIAYTSLDGSSSHAGLLQGLVSSQADGWTHALDELGRFYERAESRTDPHPDLYDGTNLLTLPAEDPPGSVREVIGAYLSNGFVLGRRIAEMHLALGRETTDPDFRPEALAAADLTRLSAELRAAVIGTFDDLERHLPQLADPAARDARRALERRRELLDRIETLAGLSPAAVKTRTHGDLHLGQVLVADGDFVILDFEGEPLRTIAERRMKQSPLRDVAGMIRSYEYAAYAGLFAYTHNRPASLERLEPWTRLWYAWNAAAFLRAYLDTADAAPFVPAERSQTGTLLAAFQIEKALYELRYEMRNRPEWIRIPLRSLLLLSGRETPA